MKNQIDYQRLKELDKKRASLLGFNLGRKRNAEEKKEYADVQKKIQAIYSKETEELRADILTTGYQINNIWEMVNSKEKYPKAIPALLKHLKRSYSDVVKEGIVRSLTVIEAKGVETSRALLDEYYKIPRNPKNIEFRWSFGNAYAVAGVKGFEEELYSIILNKENGKSRCEFIVFLGNRKIVDAVPILKRVVDGGNLDNDDFSVSSAKREIEILELHKQKYIKN